MVDNQGKVLADRHISHVRLGLIASAMGANLSGTTNTTYDKLYSLPPANCVGNGLIVSFDMLNFSPDDAPTGSLVLDRATVESLSPPATP